MKQMVTFIGHLSEQQCYHLALLPHFTAEETKAEKGEYNPFWADSLF